MPASKVSCRDRCGVEDFGRNIQKPTAAIPAKYTHPLSLSKASANSESLNLRQPAQVDLPTHLLLNPPGQASSPMPSGSGGSGSLRKQRRQAAQLPEEEVHERSAGRLWMMLKNRRERGDCDCLLETAVFL